MIEMQWRVIEQSEHDFYQNKILITVEKGTFVYAVLEYRTIVSMNLNTDEHTSISPVHTWSAWREVQLTNVPSFQKQVGY